MLHQSILPDRTCWSQQSTAASLIADCAERLPETAESTSISLAGHRNTNSHYTFRDPRVHTLYKLRRSWLERTFPDIEERNQAHFDCIGVDEAIDAAAFPALAKRVREEEAATMALRERIAAAEARLAYDPFTTPVATPLGTAFVDAGL